MMSDDEENDTETIPDKPGLYMILAAPNMTDDQLDRKLKDFARWQKKAPVDKWVYDLSQVHPVYIGETSNLKKRCRQHVSSSSDSKLSQCKSLSIAEKAQRNPKAFFLYREMRPSTAKFMENVLLHSFDFALNEEGQHNGRRKDLETTWCDAEKAFCHAYKNKKCQKEALEHYGFAKQLFDCVVKREEEAVRKELSCADGVCKKEDSFANEDDDSSDEEL